MTTPLTLNSAKTVRLSTTNSDGSIVRYSASIVKREENDGTLWVSIPERVLSLPFPPFGGKRFVQFSWAAIKAFAC